MKVALALSCLLHAAWSYDTVVNITSGSVRGTKAEDGDYVQFLGIPYAVVDMENPFGNAKQPPKFDGIFDASKNSPRCPQGKFGKPQGDLNCLSVNVYVPSKDNLTEKLPVMVWIYGGGFEGGSNSKEMVGPEYLITHDIILIAINYRVGPFGFMCLDNPLVPGNTGLKDQQLALQWVQENIENFGGDKEKVTIFGQSAGSGSSHYHVFNKKSSKLFNQVILHSGTIYAVGMLERSDPEVALQIAKHLGINASTTEDALAKLKDVQPLDVVKAGDDLHINFKPCVEKKFENVEGFMTESPVRMLESGDYTAKAMIIGHTSCETKRGSGPGGDQNDVRGTLKKRFDFKDDNQLETATNLAKEFYFGHEPTGSEKYEGRVMKFGSDFYFNYGAHRSIEFHMKSGKPVHQYVFDYEGSHKEFHFNNVSNATLGRKCVEHGGDISYLFYKSRDQNTKEDQSVIDHFTKLWTDFARYGDPTPVVTTSIDTWPAAAPRSRPYLHMGGNFTVGRDLYHKRMAFWDLFFVAFGKYYWLA